MPLRLFPFLLLLALLLSDCVDEIDLTQGAPLPDGIVLRGRMAVEDDRAEVEVVLEELFLRTSNRASKIVTATVLLENTAGQSVRLPYLEGSYRGTFGEGNAEMELTPGLGYRVAVTTREGRNFVSEYDTLAAPVVPTDIGQEFVLVDGITPAGTPTQRPSYRYSVSTPVRYADGTPAYLRYTLSLTYRLTEEPTLPPYTDNIPKACYITTPIDPGDLSLISAVEVTRDTVQDFPIAVVTLDHRYAEGNYLNMSQEAVSPGAYDYFRRIASIADQEQRSIFSNPPGPVRGNVSDADGLTQNVFGYFYTANGSLRRQATPAAALDVAQCYCPLPPPRGPGRRNPTICDDCLLAERSTTQRPDFWTLDPNSPCEE